MFTFVISKAVQTLTLRKAMLNHIGVRVKNLSELVGIFFTTGEQVQSISNTCTLHDNHFYPDSRIELWLYRTCIARITKDGKLFITYGKYGNSMTTSKRLNAILKDSSLNLSREKISYYTKLARQNVPNEVEIIEYKK
jgi:hypothetical protein